MSSTQIPEHVFPLVINEITDEYLKDLQKKLAVHLSYLTPEQQKEFLKMVLTGRIELY